MTNANLASTRQPMRASDHDADAADVTVRVLVPAAEFAQLDRSVYTERSPLGAGPSRHTDPQPTPDLDKTAEYPINIPDPDATSEYPTDDPEHQRP